MYQSLIKHINHHDPLQEIRCFILKFFIVFVLAIMTYLYFQPPQGFYLLFTTINTEVPGFMFYRRSHKIRAKLLAFGISALFILFFSASRNFEFALTIGAGILVFSVLLLGYFSPFYRAICCVAIALATPTIFHHGGWYSAVNVIINFATVLVYSIVVDYCFEKVTKNYINNGLSFIISLFVERLEMVILIMNRGYHANIKQQLKNLLLQDQGIRFKLLSLININLQSQTPVFSSKITANRLASLPILSLRQAIYGIIEYAKILKSEQQAIPEIYQQILPFAIIELKKLQHFMRYKKKYALNSQLIQQYIEQIKQHQQDPMTTISDKKFAVFALHLLQHIKQSHRLWGPLDG